MPFPSGVLYPLAPLGLPLRIAPETVVSSQSDSPIGVKQKISAGVANTFGVQWATSVCQTLLLFAILFFVEKVKG